jgi:hypothetical protein
MFIFLKKFEDYKNTKDFVKNVARLMVFYLIGLSLGKAVDTAVPELSTEYRTLLLSLFTNAIILSVLSIVFRPMLYETQNTMAGLFFVAAFFNVQKKILI